MIKKLLLAISAIIVIAIAIILVSAAMQGDELKVTRSATFNTTPDKVFEQVNDFRKWDAWSPWAKLDPNMTVTHSGAANGVGAVHTWKGNGDVGEGKMTINASHPYEHIGIDLEFIAPMAASNKTDFTFKANGDKTDVTWTMVGKKNFITKIFNVFFDLDKMIGADFEKGLAQMKPIVEATK